MPAEKDTPKGTTVNIHLATKPAEAIEAASVNLATDPKPETPNPEPAAADPVALERERFSALLAAFPDPEDRGFLATAIAAGASVDAAKAAHHATLAGRLAESRSKLAARPAAAGAPPFAASDAPAQVGPTDDAKALDQRIEADWNRDPQLRAEFGKFSTYLAYRRAEGKFQITEGKRVVA